MELRNGLEGTERRVRHLITTFFAMNNNEPRLEESGRASNSAVARVMSKQSQFTAATRLSDTDRKSQRFISNCAFCDRARLSHNCNVVSKQKARKDIVRRKGKCYVCLADERRPNH